MNEFVRILAAFASTAAFASLLGLGLAVASRKLKVEKDKRLEDLIAALPGLNCGACGYAGCESYAEQLAAGSDTDILKCSPGGAATQGALSSLLGLEADSDKERMVARLACTGGSGVAMREFLYYGYPDCESLKMHFDGDKGCKYGCLGLGSCVKVCPVEAIAHTKDGLVSVDKEKCIGCEICAAVCPTGVMKMIPADAGWFVACQSRDKAKDTKKHCRQGCIGCRICEKKFPDSGFSVADNLSVLKNNGDNEQCKGAAAACPTKCILSSD